MADLGAIVPAICVAFAAFALGVAAGHASGIRYMRQRAIDLAWEVFYRSTAVMLSGTLRIATRQLEALLRGDDGEKHADEWRKHGADRERYKLNERGILDDPTPPPGWLPFQESGTVISLQEQEGDRSRAFITETGLLGCTNRSHGAMPSNVAFWLLCRRGDLLAGKCPTEGKVRCCIKCGHFLDDVGVCRFCTGEWNYLQTPSAGDLRVATDEHGTIVVGGSDDD